MRRTFQIYKLLLLIFVIFTLVTAQPGCTVNLGDGSAVGSSEHLLLNKSFTATSGEKLMINASGADVKVSSWNKNEVSVKIYGKEKAGEYVDIFAERSSAGVLVEIKNKSIIKWVNNLGLKIEVVTPEKYSANIETSGGDVEIKDISGSLLIGTSGGDIKMMNLSGSLIAKTSGGDISLEKFDGSVEMKTSGGDVKIREGKGSVDAGTSGGDIDVQTASGTVNLGTSGGDIKLRYTGENQGINCRTSGGDIMVSVPADLKAEVALESVGGSVRCNLDATGVSMDKNKFSGNINGGGPRVICKTSGGSVSLKKE